MISLDRRAVFTAAAASAAFGLTRSLEIVAPAAAQGSSASPLNPRELPFHRFKVGDIEVTTVFDGAMLREHSPGFVKNASTEEIKASLRAAGLPDAQLPNSYTITIVKVGDRTVMFDSGNGAGRSRDIGLLKANMKAAGIDPASLTAIAVTHFHPDHIYGLYAKDDAPDYADIEIVVPDTEYAFWADPGVIAKLPPARQSIAKRVQASLPK